MSYKITYLYTEARDRECSTLNDAVNDYMQMIDNPQYSNVSILVTEERALTLEEIQQATKDRRSNVKHPDQTTQGE